MVVYLSSFRGKGKASGKDYFRVSLAEISDDGDVYQKDFFIDINNDKLIDKFSDLVFGDIVDVVFAATSALSNRMDIVDVNRKVRSPYYDDKV